jgi:hypothetical protein
MHLPRNSQKELRGLFSSPFVGRPVGQTESHLRAKKEIDPNLRFGREGSVKWK